ncbi:hypothetical protein [Scytonema sp. HK-05]|nr:hypothetical protein [Scytonema sp. HK-05]
MTTLAYLPHLPHVPYLPPSRSSALSLLPHFSIDSILRTNIMP